MVESRKVVPREIPGITTLIGVYHVVDAGLNTLADIVTKE